jgi:hypothetical protein
LKVNQDIDKMKESLFVNLTGNKTINNSNDDYPIITLSNGSNQVGTESVVSNNNQTSDQRSTNVCRACEYVCKCGNTVQGEVNTVRSGTFGDLPRSNYPEKRPCLTALSKVAICYFRVRPA